MMQTTAIRPPKVSPDGKSPLSSKSAAIIGAVVAVALAALVIVLFLKQYKDNVNKDGIPTPVLVASQLIEQGSSGDSLGAAGQFKATDVPRDQLKAGAVVDAALLRGKIAVADILPGQQLTRGDFRVAGSGPVTKLGPEQRGIMLTFDNAHGMLGAIKAGDHVDVISGFLVDRGGNGLRPELRTMMEDVLVLKAPSNIKGGKVGTSANKDKEVMLRVDAAKAPELAFAADNGKVWLVLRPLNGKSVDKRSLVTMESVLLGSRSVRGGGSGR
jgi:Flp pilus assembly protein CpaB